MKRTRWEVFGLGPLEPLLQDPTISDILSHHTAPCLYRARRPDCTRPRLNSKTTRILMRIIERIVSRVGRRVDESSPMVDARLPDGSRVNAVIPPVAVDGPILSIRRFGRDPLTDSEMVKNHTITEGMQQLLQACVAARLNIVISGGTGAGKTTLLNVLSGYIPEYERIVSIEDAAELQLRQAHVARMEARPPNTEGTGAIRIRQLVINALHVRPDQIIVGRSPPRKKALDMMQAMNTGHDGSLTTVHSNSPRDAISRLEVMMGMANASMGVHSIRQADQLGDRSVRASSPLQRRYSERDAYYRMRRHGRRHGHYAGSISCSARNRHLARTGIMQRVVSAPPVFARASTSAYELPDAICLRPCSRPWWTFPRIRYARALDNPFLRFWV